MYSDDTTLARSASLSLLKSKLPVRKITPSIKTGGLPKGFLPPTDGNGPPRRLPSLATAEADTSPFEPTRRALQFDVTDTPADISDDHFFSAAAVPRPPERRGGRQPLATLNNSKPPPPPIAEKERPAIVVDYPDGDLGFPGPPPSSQPRPLYTNRRPAAILEDDRIGTPAEDITPTWEPPPPASLPKVNSLPALPGIKPAAVTTTTTGQLSPPQNINTAADRYSPPTSGAAQTAAEFANWQPAEKRESPLAQLRRTMREAEERDAAAASLAADDLAARYGSLMTERDASSFLKSDSIFGSAIASTPQQPDPPPAPATKPTVRRTPVSREAAGAPPPPPPLPQHAAAVDLDDASTVTVATAVGPSPTRPRTQRVSSAPMTTPTQRREAAAAAMPPAAPTPEAWQQKEAASTTTTIAQAATTTTEPSPPKAPAPPVAPPKPIKQEKKTPPASNLSSHAIVGSEAKEPAPPRPDSKQQQQRPKTVDPSADSRRLPWEKRTTTAPTIAMIAAEAAKATTMTKTQLRAAAAAERRAASDYEAGRKMPARTDSGYPTTRREMARQRSETNPPPAPATPIEELKSRLQAVQKEAMATKTLTPTADATEAEPVKPMPKRMPARTDSGLRRKPKPQVEVTATEAEVVVVEEPVELEPPPNPPPMQTRSATAKAKSKLPTEYIPNAALMPNKEAPPAPAQAAEKSEQQEKPPARRPASSTRNKPKDQTTDTVSEAPSSSPAPEHVVSKVGPLGLGVVLDECNIVIDLVKGGQAEADGVLNVGDQLVGVDGEALKRRPLAKVLPPGKKQYTFAVRRNARKPSECILMETTTPNENAAAAATSEGGQAPAEAAKPKGPPKRRKAPPAKAAAAEEVENVVQEKAPPRNNGGGGNLEAWLLQKALEVSMVYRFPIKDAHVLNERIGQAERLKTFMAELRDLGDQSRLSLDIVFQSLMQALADSGRAPSIGADFDSQGGAFGKHGTADFVPMHQAKVLDRSEALKGSDAVVRSILGNRLDWMVDSADLLRKLLRVKVEDGNDLLMAIDTVDEVEKFWTKLQLLASQTGEDEYALWQRLISF